MQIWLIAGSTFIIDMQLSFLSSVSWRESLGMLMCD